MKDWLQEGSPSTNAIECLRTWQAVMGRMTSAGERPIKALMFMVAFEDDEDAVIEMAGNASAIYQTCAAIINDLIEGVS